MSILSLRRTHKPDDLAFNKGALFHKAEGHEKSVSFVDLLRRGNFRMVSGNGQERIASLEDAGYGTCTRYSSRVIEQPSTVGSETQIPVSNWPDYTSNRPLLTGTVTAG